MPRRQTEEERNRSREVDRILDAHTVRNRDRRARAATLQPQQREQVRALMPSLFQDPIPRQPYTTLQASDTRIALDAQGYAERPLTDRIPRPTRRLDPAPGPGPDSLRAYVPAPPPRPAPLPRDPSPRYDPYGQDPDRVRRSLAPAPPARNDPYGPVPGGRRATPDVTITGSSQRAAADDIYDPVRGFFRSGATQPPAQTATSRDPIRDAPAAFPQYQDSYARDIPRLGQPRRAAAPAAPAPRDLTFIQYQPNPQPIRRDPPRRQATPTAPDRVTPPPPRVPTPGRGGDPYARPPPPRQQSPLGLGSRPPPPRQQSPFSARPPPLPRQQSPFSAGTRPPPPRQQSPLGMGTRPPPRTSASPVGRGGYATPPRRQSPLGRPGPSRPPPGRGAGGGRPADSGRGR